MLCYYCRFKAQACIWNNVPGDRESTGSEPVLFLIIYMLFQQHIPVQSKPQISWGPIHRNWKHHLSTWAFVLTMILMFFFLWKNQLCSEWLSRVFLSKLSRLSWKTCRINAISRWISEIKVSLKLPEFMVFYLKSSIWLSQNKNNIPFQRN